MGSWGSAFRCIGLPDPIYTSVKLNITLHLASDPKRILLARYWQPVSQGISARFFLPRSDGQDRTVRGCNFFRHIAAQVSYTSLFTKSTSEPIRRKFDEVIFKEDEAWERSYSFNPQILCIFFEGRNRRF
jgi:hypothetical protein